MRDHLNLSYTDIKMKKVILIASALLVIMSSCGPTQNDAIKYNDSLVDIIDKLTEKQNLFLNQLDGHNIDSLKITQQLFAQQAKISTEDFAKVKPFEGKNELGKTVSDLFTILNSVANNEGKQMVELMSKDSTQYTEEDNDKVRELAAKFDEQYDKAYDKLVSVQAAFSKEWKFDLIVDKDKK